MFKLDKKTALRIARKHNKKVKLDWWSKYMYIWYDRTQKIFKSGANEPIKEEFLHDGDYEVLPSNDRHLGGLFNLSI